MSSGDFDNSMYFRLGHYFKQPAGFRLHGFKLVFAHTPGENSAGLHISKADGFVMENCLVQATVGDGLRAVLISENHTTLPNPVVVRDCIFDGGLHFTAHAHGLDALVEKLFCRLAAYVAACRP